MREAVIAAALTGDDPAVPGTLASTLIVAISIPLSILFSLAAAQLPGSHDERDDARRPGAGGRHPGGRRHGEIENIHRHMGRQAAAQAILDGAQQIAIPTFVSTLTICIVFVSVVFLTGPAKYLFTPLALAVVFAMMASYLLVPNAGADDGGVSAASRRARGATGHGMRTLRRLSGWFGRVRPVHRWLRSRSATR